MSFKTLKTAILSSLFSLLLGGGGLILLLSSCDSPMGLGKPVDLEAPVLIVTDILLADGTEIPVYEEDGKIFVGPGILFGRGAVLRGKAKDNETVEFIEVREVDRFGNPITEKSNKQYKFVWRTRVNSSKDSSGFQSWSIGLEDIEPLERFIKIEALDRPGNVGMDSVQTLTLLVDVNVPIVDNITVERKTGLGVSLKPKSELVSFTDINADETEAYKTINFEDIDYFQNEKFTIRAVIEHDFSLSSVRLNFYDSSNGKYLYSDGIAPSSNSNNTPFWEFTHNQLTAIDSKYNSGRHYMNVVITATATAGHSGTNIKEGDTVINFLNSICWYPESDFPNIATLEEDVNTKRIMVEKGAVIPITIFDDDNIGEIYADLITVAAWVAKPGETDKEKLENIAMDIDNNPSSSYNSISKLSKPAKIHVTTMTVNHNRGEYKLFVLVRDTRTNAKSSEGIWSIESYDVTVMEEGVPVISIEDPEENTSPPLTNNITFNIKGNILNLDAVDFVRIAWIPAGLGYNVQQQVNLGEKVLKSNTPEHGVKIWNLPQSALVSGTTDIGGGKIFVKQSFSFPFHVFDDFRYNNQLENEIKTFVIYTVSKGREPVDVFYTMRLLPYKQPPVINVTPNNFAVYGSNAPINFQINPVSEMGLGITNVTLYSQTAGKELTLTKSPNSNTWTATDNHAAVGDYSYVITATDAMGNVSTTDLIVRVDFPPPLLHITSPHDNGTTFSSRDTVRIYAEFERAVSAVTTVPETLKPRLLLTGLNVNNREAVYVSGEGSKILVFEYNPQVGDITQGTSVLGVQRFINPDSISATITQSQTLAANFTSPLTAKALKIDAVSPIITGIKIAKQEGKADLSEQNFAWHREGEIITFDITLSKPVRVLGNPRLILPINNGASPAVSLNRYASFQTTVSDNVMRFTYKVQDGDSFDTSNLTIASTACFSADHRLIITDTVGGQGNYLALTNNIAASGQTTDVRVDSIKPGAPTLIQTAATATSRDFRISNTGIESNTGINLGTRLEYTTNGVVWTNVPLPITAPGFYLPQLTTPTNYNVSARQIDRAGNTGPASPVHSFSLESESTIVNVVCDNPTGIYSEGSRINFKLIFNGAVLSNGTGSVTLKTGNGTNTAAISLPLPVITGNGDFSIPFSWNVDQNRRMRASDTNHVQIDSINLAGVTRVTGTQTAFSGMNTVIAAYNNLRTDVEVLSIRPTITAGSPISNAVISTANGSSVITLTFSTNVIPERGFITVKPTATAGGNAGVTTGNWLIPPVLTNEQFNTIRDALPTTANKDALLAAGRYIRTTHGIKVSGSNYVPDTDTKYVLNFETGITDTTANSNTAVLRNLMNTAKYLWQEIEVINTEKVTGAGNTAIPAIGTNVIEVRLDPLPAGRQWKVEIAANSFRDEASNYFAGWLEAEGAAATNQRWFWSQQTSEPVIRVDRVSNNRATSAQTTAMLQTNVRYRIDCVTPGATILRGEYNASGATVPSNTETNINTLRGTTGGVARITTGAMPNQGNNDPYVANAEAGHLGNSAIPDAAVTALTGMTIGTAYTMGNNVNRGGVDLGLTTDEALYTARKDYVGATATRTGLNASARGYEGIFKTIVIYRNIGGGTGNDNVFERQNPPRSGNYLKIEATNTRNGAVTIAGFPMWYNDMTGNGSRFFYRNGTANTSDWIFITWEIVSEFWQVSPISINATVPGALFNNADNDNSWEPFSANYQVHNYRLYGNWGMQRGNR